MYRFSDDFLKTTKNNIKEALEAGAEPIAAFDADGTLWATDMGENFFKYQYKNEFLTDLPNEPWNHYVKMHEEAPEESYLWLAQVNKGKDIELVRKWAREAVKTHPDLGVFAGQQEIIKYLHQLKVNVYVVTASIKWAVEPAAALFNIPQENVIGVQTKIIDGQVTTEQEGAITYKDGKVKALLEATDGKAPFFAAGNSNGDLPLLESSTDIRVVLNSAQEDSHLYQTERDMITLAKERNWLHYSF